MIRLEMKNGYMILTEKQQKYQLYHLEKLITGEEILSSYQRQIIKPVKFTYSPLGKAFEKQTKTIKQQGRKQIDAITNQNKRLADLTIKEDHKDI